MSFGGGGRERERERERERDRDFKQVGIKEQVSTYFNYQHILYRERERVSDPPVHVEFGKEVWIKEFINWQNKRILTETETTLPQPHARHVHL